MAEPAHAAQTLPPAELRDAEEAPLDPADFPGCEAVHITPEDIEEYTLATCPVFQDHLNRLDVVGKSFMKTLPDSIPLQQFGGGASGQAERDEQDTVAVHGSALVLLPSERLAREDLQVSHDLAHADRLGLQRIDRAPVAPPPPT